MSQIDLTNILQKIVLLPKDLQTEVVEYIDFMVARYWNMLDEKHREKEIILTDELKKSLDDLISQYRSADGITTSWEAILQEISQKFDFD